MITSLLALVIPLQALAPRSMAFNGGDALLVAQAARESTGNDCVILLDRPREVKKFDLKDLAPNDFRSEILRKTGFRAGSDGLESLYEPAYPLEFLPESRYPDPRKPGYQPKAFPKSIESASIISLETEAGRPWLLTSLKKLGGKSVEFHWFFKKPLVAVSAKKLTPRGFMQSVAKVLSAKLIETPEAWRFEPDLPNFRLRASAAYRAGYDVVTDPIVYRRKVAESLYRYLPDQVLKDALTDPSKEVIFDLQPGTPLHNVAREQLEFQKSWVTSQRLENPYGGVQLRKPFRLRFMATGTSVIAFPAGTVGIVL